MDSANPSSPRHFLTTEDPYAIYSPGDRIRGTANLSLQKPLLAKYIVVTLLAGCRVKRPGTEPGPSIKKLPFLKQMKVVFQNKQEDPAQQLSIGMHKWDFEFDLPSSNKLPPSFCYRDQDGTAEIAYCIIMFAYPSPGGLIKDNISSLNIKYSPKRSPSLLIEHSLNKLCQSLLVTHPYDAHARNPRRSAFSRIIRRATGRRKLEEENFHVSIHVPQHAVFSEHLDIRLKVESDNDEYSHAVEVRLIEVHYRLWGITRIAHGQQSRVGRHQVQSNVMACGNELPTHWIYLRRHAPFRVQPRPHETPLDQHAFSTLGPSFGTQHIVREYTLDIDLFLSVYGKSHRIRFEKNEIILLPYESYLENE